MPIYSPLPDTCQARVNYAVRVMLAGRNTSRRFDSCFENGDGDQVSATIWKRALKNDKLMSVLPKYIVPDIAREAYEKGLAV